MPELDFKIINIHLLSAKLTCFLLALVPQVKRDRSHSCAYFHTSAEAFGKMLIPKVLSFTPKQCVPVDIPILSILIVFIACWIMWALSVCFFPVCFSFLLDAEGCFNIE